MGCIRNGPQQSIIYDVKVRVHASLVVALNVAHDHLVSSRKINGHAARRSGFVFGLFIDDLEVNVETALRRGWRGIVHEDREGTLTALRELGLPA